MPERNVSCAVRACLKCNFQALVPEKPEPGRLLRRRDRKYLLTLAKKLNVAFLDNGDVCPKCGTVAKELNDPQNFVKFNQDATAEQVSNEVKPLIGDPKSEGEDHK